MRARIAAGLIVAAAWLVCLVVSLQGDMLGRMITQVLGRLGGWL
jgi:hypothetical protein